MAKKVLTIRGLVLVNTSVSHDMKGNSTIIKRISEAYQNKNSVVGTAHM